MANIKMYERPFFSLDLPVLVLLTFRNVDFQKIDQGYRVQFSQ